MKLSGIAYALFCIIAPLLWGLLVVWVTNRIEAKLRANQRQMHEEPPMPPIDYHI